MEGGGRGVDGEPAGVESECTWDVRGGFADRLYTTLVLEWNNS